MRWLNGLISRNSVNWVLGFEDGGNLGFSDFVAWLIGLKWNYYDGAWSM